MKDKIYWLNVWTNSIEDIILVHEHMDLAGISMGSTHVQRLKDVENFKHHFAYDECTNSYFAQQKIKSPLPENNFEKPASWFLEYIKNGFKENKYYDNTEDCIINTTLDRQLDYYKNKWKKNRYKH